MKKIITTIILTITAVTVASCGKADKKIVSEAESTQSPAVQENAVPKTSHTPAPASKTTLAADETKALNTFLSNFSEARFVSYDASSPDKDSLISFAFIHALINDNDMTIWTNSEMGISAENANEMIGKYFGLSITPEGTNRWRFDGENFMMPAASGESYSYFSIAADYIDNGDGTYTVPFNTYYAGFDEDTAPYLGYDALTAEKDEKLEFKQNGVAVVKPVTYEGKETWQLIKLS